jgi:hypothetical protein
MYRYGVYGVALHSDLPLNYPQHTASSLPADIVLQYFDGTSLRHLIDGLTPRPAGGWGEHAILHDGSIYLRWPGIAEFVLSNDGSHILCCPAHGAAVDAWQTYLLGQVLSFALVKKGIEPLHATAIVVNGHAIGFLGQAGQGKSTLAAAFLAAGHTLLTDDLLVLQESDTCVSGCPGPSRIKLFPDQAGDLLGINEGVPMNPFTPKLVIPLTLHQFHATSAPLRALYVLDSPAITAGQGVRISRLHPRRALIELLRHTFNRLMVAPDRLRRQFDSAARLAARVPVNRLRYSRNLANLAGVRHAVLADLDRRVSRG